MKWYIVFVAARDDVEKICSASSAAKSFLGSADEKHGNKEYLFYFWSHVSVYAISPPPTAGLVKATKELDVEYDLVIVNEGNGWVTNKTLQLGLLNVVENTPSISWKNMLADLAAEKDEAFFRELKKVGLNITVGEAKKIRAIARNVYADDFRSSRFGFPRAVFR